MEKCTMVNVTATQTGKANGVISQCHREPVHATVAMEPVEWEQILMAIIVYAILDSPAQTVRLQYALVDVLVNCVALSIIERIVTIYVPQTAIKNHVQTISIALWLVPPQHVSATAATLAFHLAALQFHAQRSPVESTCIAV